MWIDIDSADHLPDDGGTYAVMFNGALRWMYYNPERKTWHPMRGWRRNVGYRCHEGITAWFLLPEYE